MSRKVISSYTFSKREIESSKPRLTPQPNEDRKLPRLYQGYLLRHDQGGYYILRDPVEPNGSLIREDLPYNLGYAIDLTRDDVSNLD